MTMKTFSARVRSALCRWEKDFCCHFSPSSGHFKSPNRQLPTWRLFQAVLWFVLTEVGNSSIRDYANIFRLGKKRIVSMGEKCLMSICTKLGPFEAFEPAAAHFDAI
jgi:hypothetical protein